MEDMVTNGSGEFSWSDGVALAQKTDSDWLATLSVRNQQPHWGLQMLKVSVTVQEQKRALRFWKKRMDY